MTTSWQRPVRRGLMWCQAAPRHVKQTVLMIADALVFPLLLGFALYLRLDEWVQPGSKWLAGFWFWTLLAVVLAAFMRVYTAVIRVYDEHFLHSVFLAALLWTSVAFVMVQFALSYRLPRTVILTTGFLWMTYLWASRWLIRAVITKLFQQVAAPFRRVLAVYGAGQGGRQLMSAIQDMPTIHAVAFFDDDPQLARTRILGVPVFPGHHVERHVTRLGIDEVILAMPSAGMQRQKQVVEHLERVTVKDKPLRVRLLPGLDDIVGGKISLNSVREVDILDLLGREPMPVQHALFSNHVADRVVLVTGAAGSIGSELCRQILTARPKALLLFDHSEYGLYTIEQELTQAFPDQRIVPLLGNVLDQERLTRIMTVQGVQSVYHAAAYKHVPLVEANPFEGLENNTVGTWRTALAAEAAGVESFVLVSTDKAVRPTNVMGASKRLAEMTLQALAASGSRTLFSMVRFGNVLGSSGSVIPRFRQQIAEGGPLTLTHPEITRYFMTIPEAAQLVIQAGGLAQGGEVFLLEMGEPVRIVDLARRMIRLSGLTERTPEHPDGDIELVYTGLRPGEKLFEELLISDEDVSRTRHDRIYCAREPVLPRETIEQLLQQLELFASERDTRGLKLWLQQVVAGYQPDLSAQDHAWGSVA